MIVSILIAITVISVIFCPETPLTAYNRPDSSASVFGTLEAGEAVDISVKTTGFWLGFDPGTAQAANTGSFRYRWLPPGTEVTADMDSLETVWAPEPGVTYAMTSVETQVWAEPDSESIPLAAIGSNSAAGVVEISGNWIKVNLNDSPEPEDIKGWISFTGVSINSL